MSNKYRNLFPQIADRSSLWEAYKNASNGKRHSFGYLIFRQYEAANIENIIEQLNSGIYTPGEHNVFYVYEPKERKISALPFLDRIVQHSLYKAINPIFEITFLPSSFACRKNKGTHRGVKYVQSLIRKMPDDAWFLKVDFKSYFHNVDREILWKEIDKKIKCKKTLELLEKFHPREGKGLPIGNLTSQLLANVYGHILDRYLQHELKVKAWARYMDDTIIFGESQEELEEVHKKLTEFASTKMRLTWSKWSIRPATFGVNFLGYRIFKNYKLIRKASVRRAKRKIHRYKKFGNTEKLEKFLASWRGHIQWADSHNLKKKLDLL